MAINFPNSPVNGNTYKYNEVTYIYSKNGTDEGYWKVALPSVSGVATVAEVDTGVDNIKYISPAALRGSKYSTLINKDYIEGTSKKVVEDITGRANNAPVVSFIFDDAFDSAYNTVAPLFESRGVRCGFAVPFRLLGVSGFSTKTQIKDLYSRGFEIGNHTLNNTILTSGSTLDSTTGEAEIVGGYKELVALGVDPRFFVAVSGSLDTKFSEYVKLNHELSFPRGTAGVGATGIQDEELDKYNLKRESLFSIGVAGAKATIDYVVANGGYAQFYDHDPLQIGFPNSLSTIEITEILDYAISSGVKVLTPSKALDLCSADLVNGRDVKLDSINSKDNLINKDNLISDSEFTSIGITNGTLIPLTAWIVENSGSGTVTPERIGGSVGALKLRIEANTNVGDIITVKNKTVRFDDASTYWRNSNLCFAIDLTGVNNNFEDSYTSKVGIELRRTDDDSIITSKVVNIDLSPFTRTVYATLETPVGIDFYVKSFFSVTVVSPLLVNLIAAKPTVSLTSKPVPYSSTPDFVNRISKTPLKWRMDSTVIPTGIRTNIPITVGAIQNDIGRFEAGSFWAYQKGLYRIEVVNIASSSGDTSGAKTIMGMNLNGTFAEELEGVGQGTRSVFTATTTMELQPLDYIDPYIAQYSGVNVTTDGGATCIFRVTYLGQ